MSAGDEAPVAAVPGIMGDPAHRRFLACGIVSVVIGWLAGNFLYAAAERETLDHPPNYPELYIGVALTVLTVPLAVVALRRPGAPRVLGWIGVGLAAFGVVSIIAILLQPPLR